MKQKSFVVRELPRVGEPIQPEFISEAFRLPLDRTNVILDELEKNLFFLVRNEQGAVFGDNKNRVRSLRPTNGDHSG